MRGDKNREFTDKIQMETLFTKPTGKNGRGFFNS